jgi:RNA polymerase sigma-70 factor (ECF subfamily)
LHRSRRGGTIRAVQRALLDALAGAAADPAVDAVALGAACADVARGVAARWPAWLAPEAFAGYVAARIDPALDPVAALGELYAADLYLACACARGVAAAHGALEREYVAELPAALRAIDPRTDFVEEVLQQLREKMLVVADGAARIEAYSGHGPLGAWLRVSALRLALTLRRRGQPLAADDDLAALLDPSPTAEATVLAIRVGADVRAALRDAIAALPARTRAVLRLYYADGHGVEDIGRVYRVHASTVSRWLAKARVDILAATRASLVERLAASASEIDSVLGHAASVELNLSSVLRTGTLEA